MRMKLSKDVAVSILLDLGQQAAVSFNLLALHFFKFRSALLELFSQSLFHPASLLIRLDILHSRRA